MAWKWNQIADIMGPAGDAAALGRFEKLELRTFPTGGNIDSYRTAEYDGPWAVNSLTDYDAMTGTKPPVRSPGRFRIEVLGTSAFQTYMYWFGNEKATVRRTYSALSPGLGWSPWKRVVEFDDAKVRTLLKFQNVDEMVTLEWVGDWSVPDFTIYDSLGGTKPPVRSPGVFTVKPMSANTGAAAFQEYSYWYGADKSVVRRTYSPLSPGLGWSAWKRVVEADPALPVTSDSASPGLSNSINKGQLLRAKGGTIGTSGKAAVCVRLDHGFNAVKASILALADQYNIPISAAVMAGDLGKAGTESENVTATELQGWAINRGWELANHSTSHADQISEADIAGAITGNLVAMKAAMPELEFPSFIQPGVAGTKWSGFNNGTDASLYGTHIAGRTILANHAVATGNIPGPVIALSGEIPQGAAPFGLDLASTVSIAETAINDAIERGAGLSVYFHPSLIGSGSNTTLLRLESFFAFLAGKVDAGQVILLTQSGLAIADSRSSVRQDLAYASRWTTASGVTSQTISLDSLADAKGYVRSLEATVTSSAGTTVKLEATSAGGLAASKTFTIPAGTTGRTYRLPFTIPKSATAVTVKITTTATLVSKRVVAI